MCYICYAQHFYLNSNIYHITDITGITHNRKSQKIPQSENSLEKLYGGWFGWWAVLKDTLVTSNHSICTLCLQSTREQHES